MKINLEEFARLKQKLKPATKVNILSDSMEPFIFKGETIEIDPCPKDKVCVGDAIVFWHNNRLICHFVTKVINKPEYYEFITKGLSSIEYDSPVHEKQLLGKVTTPKMGFIKKFIYRMYFSFKSI